MQNEPSASAAAATAEIPAHYVYRAHVTAAAAKPVLTGAGGRLCELRSRLRARIHVRARAHGRKDRNERRRKVEGGTGCSY